MASWGLARARIAGRIRSVTDRGFTHAVFDSDGSGVAPLDVSGLEVSPWCDVCGPAWFYVGREMRIEGRGGFVTSMCSFCRGLVEAGVLRSETVVEGDVISVRWRQWAFEWTPGELLPEQVRPSATA